ncbi:MAG: ABC transporter ATP-binding protein [Oscillospiraceae bacterium]|jgi:multidrug/hemolysin transport system ATP-binding protein|nr:ABC transporter ATP-binding protein [Oscillospiraceae bacterium]
MPNKILEINNLTKSFNGVKAVDKLSLCVEEGTLFAFLGQNGAGKSTTINVILGLLKAESGTISYGGSKDFSTFKPQIGVVFQNNVFDENLSVEENLLLYGQLYLNNSKLVKRRYAEILELMQLKEYAKKRFKLLSGGQKRKAELARALFNEPRLLFLDEPTTGLDPKTRAEVWSIIHELRRRTGMTVFLTTHYMEETADADSVVIIHKGKKVTQGSPAELKAAYSHDKLRLTPVNAELLEAWLKEHSLPFEKTADTYSLVMENAESAIALLYELRQNIRFFEAIQGTMDDVFLNAVGESLEGESNG